MRTLRRQTASWLLKHDGIAFALFVIAALALQFIVGPHGVWWAH